MIIWLYRRWKKSRQSTSASEKALEFPSQHSILTTEEGSGKRARSSREVIKYRLALFASLVLPVFLETLDYTVVATSQPHIASAFNRLDLQGYIGSTYLLTSAVFLPVFASVADVYGRYWAMQSSVILFMLGSALSTGATNMPMMLAGRGIAGIGAAGLLTVVRVIIADSRSLDENNWQAAMMVLLYCVGFSVGPTIGGALTTVTFRWVFGINLPCCALALILIFLLLRTRAKGPQPPRLLVSQDTATDKILRIDWVATVLFVGGGILILLGLTWGANEVWHQAKVIASLTVGGLLIVATFLWEYVLEHKQLKFHATGTNSPTSDSAEGCGNGERLSRWFAADAMIPLAIFQNYDVCATQFAAFTSGMVMLVIFYFVAIFMVIVSGLTAVQAGIQLIYFAPGMGAGTVISITLLKLTRQPKFPIIIGSLLIPIALGLISRGMEINKQAEINGFMVMTGVGVGMSFGPLAIHARFSQPEERVAIVTALNLFFRSLGGTVGLAQCTTVMNAKVKAYFASLPSSAFADFQSDGSGVTSLSVEGLASLQSIDALPPSIQTLVKNAFRDGVRWSFISLVPWAGVTVFLVLFLSRIPDTDEGKAGDKIPQARDVELEKREAD